jgi:hypothetical protein
MNRDVSLHSQIVMKIRGTSRLATIVILEARFGAIMMRSIHGNLKSASLRRGRVPPLFPSIKLNLFDTISVVNDYEITDDK